MPDLEQVPWGARTPKGSYAATREGAGPGSKDITGAYKSGPAAVLQRERDRPPISMYIRGLARQAARTHQHEPTYLYIQNECRLIVQEATRRVGRRGKRTQQTTQKAVQDRRQDQIFQAVREELRGLNGRRIHGTSNGRRGGRIEGAVQAYIQQPTFRRRV